MTSGKKPCKLSVPPPVVSDLDWHNSKYNIESIIVKPGLLSLTPADQMRDAVDVPRHLLTWPTCSGHTVNCPTSGSHFLYKLKDFEFENLSVPANKIFLVAHRTKSKRWWLKWMSLLLPLWLSIGKFFSYGSCPCSPHSRPGCLTLCFPWDLRKLNLRFEAPPIDSVSLEATHNVNQLPSGEVSL